MSEELTKSQNGQFFFERVIRGQFVYFEKLKLSVPIKSARDNPDPDHTGSSSDGEISRRCGLFIQNQVDCLGGCNGTCGAQLIFSLSPRSATNFMKVHSAAGGTNISPTYKEYMHKY